MTVIQEKRKKNLEDEMACTAYAEAGIECPIEGDKTKAKSRSIEDEMACAAYHEAGEDCPIEPNGD